MLEGHYCKCSDKALLILVCWKGMYLSKRDFLKLVPTLVYLMLQQYKSQYYSGFYNIG